MMTFLKSTARGLETVAELTCGSWINVTDPDAGEIAYLQQTVGIPRDFVTHSLDVHERARTEKEDGMTLIVVRTPHFQGGTARAPYMTAPLGIILTDKFIVTISKMATGVVQELATGQVKDLSTANRHRFVLHALFNTAASYLLHLQEINAAVEAIEDKLQHSLRNREVQALLEHQKSLVYFTTALKSNELMMERLQKSRLFDTDPDAADFLEDVFTENHQAIEMTNIAGNILSQMMDAFASIVSNNLNAVMKFLASFTIILTFPTMVASFYGMNVGLPLQNSPHAFALTLAASVGLSLAVALIFWKKDWF